MPKINVRLTPDQHALLTGWASDANRSLQREIVWRLFREGPDADDAPGSDAPGSQTGKTPQGTHASAGHPSPASQTAGASEGQSSDATQKRGASEGQPTDDLHPADAPGPSASATQRTSADEVQTFFKTKTQKGRRK